MQKIHRKRIIVAEIVLDRGTISKPFLPSDRISDVQDFAKKNGAKKVNIFVFN